MRGFAAFTRWSAVTFTLFATVTCGSSGTPPSQFDMTASGGSAGAGKGGAGGAPLTDSAAGTTAHSGGAAGSGIVTNPGIPDASLDTSCQNLECYQNKCASAGCKVAACADGGTTSISGKVYDPAGKVPLYNVIVYVPNTTPDPIVTGASCDRCGSVAGNPVASALTDATGSFVLNDVPVTDNVPLVIQVGKWRRQLTVSGIKSCDDTIIDDPNLMRLPRNQTEGDLPKIALTTGSADALECLLRKVGISDSEFTPETGTGRVNLFVGNNGTPRYAPALNGGAAFTAAPTFWSSLDTLKQYDVVLLSCEGTENPTNKSPQALQAMLDYMNFGGRVFASHWHNYWLEHGPAPLPTVATFNHQSDLPSPFTAQIDTSFAKGSALADWLVSVGGSITRGQLVIQAAQHTVDAANAMIAQPWIYSTTPASVQYMTVNTPVGAAEDALCGRVVLSDIHVSNTGGNQATTDRSANNLAFPNGCRTTDLSPQEKALEFMLFDLSSCIRKDSVPPMPPIVVK
jgi:hypothetical protein